MNKSILIILICSGILFFGFLIYFLIKSALKWSNSFQKQEMDELDGRDFEFFCADLLKRRGFMEVEVTKGSGDYGIDILAEKEGITYGIQCKCYQEPVVVKAIQEAYAGKEYYDCMVGAVMTTQYFTAPAVEAAKKLKILLWDRGYIDHMIKE